MRFLILEKQMPMPTRKEDNCHMGHIENKYIEQMISWYRLRGKEVELKYFTYAEIQTHPHLFEVYTSNFTKLGQF